MNEEVDYEWRGKQTSKQIKASCMERERKKLTLVQSVQPTGLFRCKVLAPASRNADIQTFSFSFLDFSFLSKIWWKQKKQGVRCRQKARWQHWQNCYAVTLKTIYLLWTKFQLIEITHKVNTVRVFVTYCFDQQKWNSADNCESTSDLTLKNSRNTKV